jgi:MFS family permease
MKHTRMPDIFYGWFVVATVFVVIMVTGGARSSIGVFVLPMSEDFGWSRSVISFGGAAGILIGGISQPFMGSLYDRIGGRKLILSGVLVIGCTFIFLTATFHFLYFILIFSVVNAIAMSAGSMTTGAVIITKWFQRNRSTAISFAAAGASVGGMILVPFVTYLIILTDWRIAWSVLGLIIIILVFPLVFLLLRNDPKDMNLLPDGDQSQSVETSTKKQLHSGPLFVDRWQNAFSSIPIWELCITYFVCGFTTLIMAFHFVPYAVESGFPPSAAATAFGLLSAMNTVGALIVGPLADKFGNKNLLSFAYGFRGLGYLCILMLPGQWGLWAFAVIGGASWIATVPLTISLTTDFYGLKKAGTLSGIVFMSHQIGGSIGIQFGGIMRDVTGSYTVPFVIATLLLLAASSISFVINERRYSSRYLPPPSVSLSYNT